MASDDKRKAIDLFCGAGGFSNGFERAGVDIDIGIDVNSAALKTYEHNHDSDALEHDIREGVPDKIKKNNYEIVFGSPPCKGFSDARGSRYIDDERNGLVFEYIHWVSVLEPDVAIMENVTGMRTIGDDFMDAVHGEFEDSGYPHVEVRELNSATFGVPQKRKRVIIIATHKDAGFKPSFPPESKEENAPDNVKSLLPRPRTTVKEALEDLPEVTDDGVVEHNYGISDMSTLYSEYVRDLDDDEKLKNHRAKQPRSDEHAQKIVQRLEPGEMYRSTRFGERYRQVWDILSDEFTDCENECFKFIGRHRSRKEYRIKGKSVGHVDVEKLKDELPFDSKKVENTLEDLEERGWIRTDEVDGKTGYDLNTNSGVRPRYMRLQPDSQSNTILTTDFKPRDKLHPYKNRGLSLREGARIQSFPDSFVFQGKFDEIASQIGNAVPPLMAYRIATHILEKMDES